MLITVMVVVLGVEPGPSSKANLEGYKTCLEVVDLQSASCDQVATGFVEFSKRSTATDICMRAERAARLRCIESHRIPGGPELRKFNEETDAVRDAFQACGSALQERVGICVRTSSAEVCKTTLNAEMDACKAKLESDQAAAIARFDAALAKISKAWQK